MTTQIDTGRSCSRSALLLALACSAGLFWITFLGIAVFGAPGWLAALAYALISGLAAFFGMYVLFYAVFRFRAARQPSEDGSPERQST